MTVTLRSGRYDLLIKDRGEGYGLEVRETGKGEEIGSNPRPAIIELRDYAARNTVLESPYESAVPKDGGVLCTADVTTGNGSVIRITDFYAPEDGDGDFSVDRKAEIVSASPDDVGFCTRFTFFLNGSGDLLDYDYMAPGAWYRQNDFVPPHRIFSDKTLSHYWYKETRYALPVFMMQSRETGRAVSLGHLCPELDTGVNEATYGWVEWLNSPTLKYGSIGCHRENGRAAVDFIWPGCEGADNIMHGANTRSDNVDLSWLRRSNPVEAGFSQSYCLCLRIADCDGYYGAMTETWRYFYRRIGYPKVACDNRKVYETGVRLLDTYTRDYCGVTGLPFVVNLPNGEPDSVSFQMGFVGQQIGCGYQLMRYGHENGLPDCFGKGRSIVDFWARNSLTECGLPMTWYMPAKGGFHDCVIHIRCVSDGLEAALDAYKFTKSIGEEHPGWLDYCVTVGDWFVANQNPDGSWYRTFDFDGNPILKTPYNTTNPLRFLANLYAETGDERYRKALERAGEFCYEHIYKEFHYSGAIFDGPNTSDKEAGIYAMFGFTALYDLFGDRRYLEAACAAASYTETWTYSYEFPNYCDSEDPIGRPDVGVSGMSAVTAGSGGGDVYMAACPFAFYRLYLLSGDAHFCEFADFLMKNTRQTTDVDGKFGYRYPGLVAEGGDIVLMRGARRPRYWLPWCTFVQIDPILRLRDVFGVYEIGDAEKIPYEKRTELNGTLGRFR